MKNARSGYDVTEAPLVYTCSMTLLLFRCSFNGKVLRLITAGCWVLTIQPRLVDEAEGIVSFYLLFAVRYASRAAGILVAEAEGASRSSLNPCALMYSAVTLPKHATSCSPCS